jgi:hypothetical protein
MTRKEGDLIIPTVHLAKAMVNLASSNRTLWALSPSAPELMMRGRHDDESLSSALHVCEGSFGWGSLSAPELMAQHAVPSHTVETTSKQDVMVHGEDVIVATLVAPLPPSPTTIPSVTA